MGRKVVDHMVLTHAGSGFCGCGGAVVECHQYYWHCLWTSGVLLAVNISWRMGPLEEQEGAVVGVFSPLPSGPASSPLKYTPPALATTPLQRT